MLAQIAVIVGFIAIVAVLLSCILLMASDTADPPRDEHGRTIREGGDMDLEDEFEPP